MIREQLPARRRQRMVRPRAFVYPSFLYKVAAQEPAQIRRGPGNSWILLQRPRFLGREALWLASRALALGESLTMIGKLLGHTQVQTTARYAPSPAIPSRALQDGSPGSIGANLMGDGDAAGAR